MRADRGQVRERMHALAVCADGLHHLFETTTYVTRCTGSVDYVTSRIGPERDVTCPDCLALLAAERLAASEH